MADNTIQLITVLLSIHSSHKEHFDVVQYIRNSARKKPAIAPIKALYLIRVTMPPLTMEYNLLL